MLVNKVSSSKGNGFLLDTLIKQYLVYFANFIIRKYECIASKLKIIFYLQRKQASLFGWAVEPAEFAAVKSKNAANEINATIAQRTFATENGVRCCYLLLSILWNKNLFIEYLYYQYI